MAQTNHGDDTAAIPLETLSPNRKSSDSIKSSELGHLLSENEDLASDSTSLTLNDSRLPDQDTSRQAWTCLLGSWLLEAMGWGFPISFGIFQQTYASLQPFSEPESAPWIPTIGTLATGLAFLGVPLINALLLRWPERQWTICFVGWLTTLLGLIGASFAGSVWGLMFWQGVVYGLGWLACYTPCLFMLNGWFVKRRGLVYGLLFGASGVSGLIIPNALEVVIERYGFRMALRVYAVATVVLGGPGLLLIRSRESLLVTTNDGQSDQEHTALVSSNRNLQRQLSSKHFWLLLIVIFIQSLGFFIPNIFIPSFARDLGLSLASSSSLLAVISLAQFLGQVWQGWISDRVNIYFPVFVSTLVPGIAALVLWGPAKGMAMLIPFAFIWGFFSASYSVLYTRMSTFLAKDGDRVDENVTILLYGLFSFERGLANILEGPISSFLIGEGNLPIDRDSFALGKYRDLVWFTVGSMWVSSLAGIGWFWTKYRREET